MPIAVCKNDEELLAWLEDTVSSGRFRVIVTDENEVIIEPTKTSKPLKFAYLQTSNPESVAREIGERFNLKVLHLKAYRWNEERGPFVKIPIEE
ncbi:MAG: hypothetical protein QW764_02975 [Desulfurococcaceae archaeon]